MLFYVPLYVSCTCIMYDFNRTTDYFLVCLFIVFIPCKKICEFSHFDSLLVVFGDLFVHSMPCFSSPSFHCTTSLEQQRANFENSKEKSTGCCTFTDDKDVGLFVTVNKASIPSLRNWLKDCGVCIVVIFRLLIELECVDAK